ncbi:MULTISPECIES: TPM domain-containing protein [unclassified Cytobacillus]|uniref:TPM domain-containing protein n=1 Tax=unclassified Cytobacillus TaxID=2675268 RepID=UPI0013581BC5|nr:TPM domain-containing protein [Cytobacillus sp. AMY 15.2]KAF0819815.1 Beta-propeller domains of methanol dehydrogenase type [Bacillus sp. ZZV12-4809]MCM3092312.1 TPM domain-containing protein [Cytobacillus sp. AMY 15.2]
MIIRRVFLTLLLVNVIMGAFSVHAEESIPQPAGDIYVQDFAGVLNEQEKSELNSLGRQLEDQTTAQAAVLIVETIGNRTIEEYANEAFRSYGIGSAAENNGVLLVVSMQDRKVRIEVGYGLEGRIPDGKAGRILDQITIPYLQNGQPNNAVIETYKVLVQEAAGEVNLGNSGEYTDAGKEDGGIGIPSWLLIFIAIGLLFLDIKFFGGTFSYAILSILSRGGGRGGGGPRGGGGGSSGGGGASRGW